MRMVGRSGPAGGSADDPPPRTAGPPRGTIFQQALAVLLLRLNLVVQREVDPADPDGSHQCDKQLLGHGH